VNTATGNNQSAPDVARLEDGGFVITWTSLQQDGSSNGVYAQRYDYLGNAVGAETRVNTTTLDSQSLSSVTALADGGYAVTWTEINGISPAEIYAQVYDSAGVPVGSEVQVSSTKDTFSLSSVTALADGSFTVAWVDHLGQSGIFARQFTPVSSTTADGGNNALTGAASADTINGEAGNDQIAGLLGNDVLAGSAGTDRLFGGIGDDILSADRQNGFDNFREVDEIYGGAGNDTIFSGYGDIVDGGDGFDTVGLSYIGATAGINGDTQILQSGQALVAGAGTFRNVERFSDIALTNFDDRMVIGDQFEPATVRAWDGNDHLIGQRVSITMYGGNGNDLLVGSIANDIIYGESGNDRLLGYFGSDLLWGGSGSDVFFFALDTEMDSIQDFEKGVDKIDLTSVDANGSVAGRQSLNFIGTAEFSGAAGELRIYQDSGVDYRIAADVNGDRTADLLISLGSVQVSSIDFIL
jgi:Ca2+-binding RTX toxin-like protein